MEYFLFLVWVLYLLPWLIAEKREHPRSLYVLALTVCLGWTVVGWIAALVWARRRPPEPPPRPALRLISNPVRMPSTARSGSPLRSRPEAAEQREQPAVRGSPLWSRPKAAEQREQPAKPAVRGNDAGTGLRR